MRVKIDFPEFDPPSETFFHYFFTHTVDPRPLRASLTTHALCPSLVDAIFLVYRR